MRDGSPRRLRDNPAAAFFMRRQLVRMPAFGDRLSEAEMRQITHYVHWLRNRLGAAMSGVSGLID